MKYGSGRSISDQEVESTSLSAGVLISNILHNLADNCARFHEQGSDEVLDLSTLSVTTERDAKYPSTHIVLYYETTNKE